MAVWQKHPLVEELAQIEMLWNQNYDQALLRANTIVVYLIHAGLISDGIVYRNQAARKDTFVE